MKIRLRLMREENAHIYHVDVGSCIQLEIEEYLKGVLPSEIFESRTPMQAKCAMAIAARTYALRKALDGSTITDTLSCQSYEAELVVASPNCCEAVERTRGMVLMYDGKVIQCYYSSSNGGVTKRTEDVWSASLPYYAARADPWDAAARRAAAIQGRTIAASHGVGLSQVGAEYAARMGESYADILAFYYPGAQIAYYEEEKYMGLDPKKVVEIARGEVGYLEKKSVSQLDSKTANAGSNNITKYARDLDALGFYNYKKQGVAWCDQFVDWCFTTAYGLEAALAMTFQPLGKGNLGAGCQYSRNYYKKAGRLFDTPQVGDQIFFWNSSKSRVSHTGIVVGVDATRVYTIEGNTSSASGVVANGGCVREKSYLLTYTRLAGFGRPDWNVQAAAGTDAPADSEATAAPMVGITVASGSWNVRVGPGTKFKSMGTVKGGAVLAIPDTDGWLPVLHEGAIGWISPKAVQKSSGDSFCVTIPGVDAATAAYLLEAYAGAKAATE